MFITSQNEIIHLMPTARWDRVDQLKSYLEEEERTALEPLLGEALYHHLCNEYVRLTQEYEDITAETVIPIHKAKEDASLPHADITARMDSIASGEFQSASFPLEPEYNREVPEKDMQTIMLIRYCQQIEFYRMLSHKAGLLTVSFNEGGGMNVVSADGYDGADEKAKDRVVKDAFMSAGRSTDSLLLFLEADAKHERYFTDLWQEADAFYLHKDLLFQTARILNEYLDIKGERAAYVSLVRDIRFCQNTYLKPRIGLKLLKAVVEYANLGLPCPPPNDEDSSDSGEEVLDSEVYDELVVLLRTALGFYVESRKMTIGPKEERMARRDSMTDAQQAMAAACEFVAEHLDALGEAVIDTPIYKEVRAREAKERWEREHREQAEERRHRKALHDGRKKLFTAFPATHRNPETK